MIKTPIKSHIFSCNVGESIFIGNQVSATILSIENGKVNLCIKAPNSLHILNEEIYRHTIRRTNKRSKR